MAMAQAPATLPMRLGYYAPPHETCAAALRGESVDGIVVRPRSFAFSDGVVDVTRITREANGDWSLTERTEGESGGSHVMTTKVRIVTQTSFARIVPNAENPKGPPDSTTYSFCSTSVPADYNL